MKCQKCNGRGKILHDWLPNETCHNCNGTGYVDMTNEEWLRSATTEQLVHVIHLMTTSCYVCGQEGVDYKRCYFHKKCTGPKEIEEWLKEKHK